MSRADREGHPPSDAQTIFSQEKIRIVLDSLRGEHSIAELCRREGIAESLYYTWSREFLEAGKRRLAGDTARGDQRRGQGPAPGSPRAEGGRRRAGPGIAPANEKRSNEPHSKIVACNTK
jgi:transposase-like protein